MKSELYHHPTKGLCILISGIDPSDFNASIPSLVRGGMFTDIMKIANEIRAGRKIPAIKECRSQTGWGLKEAKEYIDKYLSGYIDDNGMYREEKLESMYKMFLTDHMPKDFIEKDDFEL